MMRLNETTRARLMVAHGLAMVGLGLGLFYLRATMTGFLFYIFGSAFSLLLVAASLLFIAALDWISAAGLGSRELANLRGLLLLSTAAAGSAVFLLLYPDTTIRMLCYLTAVYALLLGVGKLRFASHWRSTWREQLVMYTLACIAVCFGVLLISTANRDERDVLAIVASYSLFIGLQMLLSMFYLREQRPKLEGNKAGPRQPHG